MTRDKLGSIVTLKICLSTKYGKCTFLETEVHLGDIFNAVSIIVSKKFFIATHNTF